MAMQALRWLRATGPLAGQPEGQPGQQGCGNPRVGKAAGGGAGHELRIAEVLQVSRIRQSAYGADQFDGRHREQGPRHQHRQGQPPGTAVQQHDHQAGNAEVRQVAERVGPAEGEADAQRSCEHQTGQAGERGVRMVQAARDDVHENSHAIRCS
ncbi:hypothetical protein D3C78_1162680 [compost metagenome]